MAPNISEISVRKLYRDCLKLTYHIAANSAKGDGMRQMVRSSFRAQMHVTDDADDDADDAALATLALLEELEVPAGGPAAQPAPGAAGGSTPPAAGGASSFPAPPGGAGGEATVMLLKAVITAFPCVSLPFLAVPLL